MIRHGAFLSAEIHHGLLRPTVACHPKTPEFSIRRPHSTQRYGGKKGLSLAWVLHRLIYTVRVNRLVYESFTKELLWDLGGIERVETLDA